MIRLTIWRSASTAAILAAGGLTGLALLHLLRPAYAERFGDILMVLAFLVAAILLQLSNVWTAAVRFQKQEPFILLTWSVAAVMLAASVLLGSRFSGTGIGLAFLAAVTVLAIGARRIGIRRMSALFVGETPGVTGGPRTSDH